jgi:hypothetical protein
VENDQVRHDPESVQEIVRRAAYRWIPAGYASTTWKCNQRNKRA